MGACYEATLSEILSDPIVLMVMAADGVDPREFESNLRAVEERRQAPGGAASAQRPAGKEPA